MGSGSLQLPFRALPHLPASCRITRGVFVTGVVGFECLPALLSGLLSSLARVSSMRYYVGWLFKQILCLPGGVGPPAFLGQCTVSSPAQCFIFTAICFATACFIAYYITPRALYPLLYFRGRGAILGGVVLGGLGFAKFRVWGFRSLSLDSDMRFSVRVRGWRA